MSAMSLEEQVKQNIYKKYTEADALLQRCSMESRIVPPGSKTTSVQSWPEFAAAVFAEYRMVRPKLNYIDKIGKSQTQKDRLKRLVELDQWILNGIDDWKKLIPYHLIIGEFLELDGITRFEREMPNKARVMLRTN